MSATAVTSYESSMFELKTRNTQLEPLRVTATEDGNPGLLPGSADSTRLLPGLHRRNLDQSSLIGLLRRCTRPFPELLFEAHRVGDDARWVVGESY